MKILDTLHEAISSKKLELAAWFRDHAQKSRVPIYCSVDIRNSGYKIAAVDTNLYPAGFNNIFHRDLCLAASFIDPFFQRRYKQKFQRVLIIPEDHTRNLPYLDNVFSIKRLFEQAGFEVEIATLSPELRKDKIELQLSDNRTLVYHQALREGRRLKIKDFDPDLILINNDFSSQYPPILKDLEQPLAPPIEAGWHSRRKNRHFEILHQMISECASILNVDPWLMMAETSVVKEVDIQEESGRKRLAQTATDILEKTRKNFERAGIKETPYIFLKDNSGTYGFAVMTIQKPEEILELNSKMRKKMSTAKGGAKVSEILVQEGVPTQVMVGNCPAEPVIYMTGGEVIGGFFRLHCEASETESLNQKGSCFSLLTFASAVELNNPPDAYRDDKSVVVYGNLAKIAYLAAGYEIQEILDSFKGQVP